MKKIRSFLLVFSFLFFGIGSSPANFIIFPLAKIFLSEEKFIYFSSNFIQKAWAFFIGYLKAIRLIQVEIKNKEALLNIKNKVIVATHTSFIDVMVLMSLIPNTTCFVKNALTKNFVLKNIVNSIFIPNDIEIEELKKETKKYLDMGFNVIVFPMGTRYKIGETPKIKKGASLIAINANKDIQPIKIYPDEEFLCVHEPFWSAGKKVAKYEIETLEMIKINEFYNDSDIVMKRNITKEIANRLYN